MPGLKAALFFFENVCGFLPILNLWKRQIIHSFWSIFKNWINNPVYENGKPKSLCHDQFCPFPSGSNAPMLSPFFAPLLWSQSRRDFHFFLCFIILSPLHGQTICFHPSFLILSIWSTGICKAQHVNLVPNWHTTPVLIIVILPFHIKINFLYDTLHRSVPKHSDTKMSWTKRASRKGTFKLSKINHNTNFIKFHSKMLEIDENIFTV